MFWQHRGLVRVVMSCVTPLTDAAQGRRSGGQPCQRVHTPKAAGAGSLAWRVQEETLKALHWHCSDEGPSQAIGSPARPRASGAQPQTGSRDQKGLEMTEAAAKTRYSATPAASGLALQESGRSTCCLVFCDAGAEFARD